MLGDGRLDARVLKLRVRVEDRKEAAHDEVVDTAIVGAHLVELVLGVGRDDRVVVSDLLIVDDAPEGQQVEAGHVFSRCRVFGVATNLLGGWLDLIDHVCRQVARVCPWVRERLVLLVAALRSAERPLCREAEARVGVALERSEVVKHRRLFGLLRLVELCDLAALALDGCDDLVRRSLLLYPRLCAGVVAALVLATTIGLKLGVD